MAPHQRPSRLQEQEQQQQQVQHEVQQRGWCGGAVAVAPLADMVAAAGTSGLLLTSHATYWVLLLLPCMVWALCLGAGVLHFEGLPASKGAVQHALAWFDRHVFRTAAGSLPFIVLAWRWVTMQLWSLFGASRLDLSAAGRSRALGLHSPAGTKGSAQGAGRASATLAARCLVAYALVAALRVAVYVAHLKAQGGGAAGGLRGQAYLSDHVLLGASVVTCLGVELICAASDLCKLKAVRAPLLWCLLICATALAAALLSCLLSLDMYFTARHFHHPQESVLAVVLGAALFQGPLLKWLHRQRRRGGEVAAGSVVLAEVVRAEAVVSRCEVTGE